MIPFKMMYNMSMLRYRFSNEQLRGALNHLPLLFCKSVYLWNDTKAFDKKEQSGLQKYKQ